MEMQRDHSYRRAIEGAYRDLSSSADHMRIQSLCDGLMGLHLLRKQTLFRNARARIVTALVDLDVIESDEDLATLLLCVRQQIVDLGKRLKRVPMCVICIGLSVDRMDSVIIQTALRRENRRAMLVLIDSQSGGIVLPGRWSIGRYDRPSNEISKRSEFLFSEVRGGLYDPIAMDLEIKGLLKVIVKVAEDG